jgi:hypothetical protein
MFHTWLQQWARRTKRSRRPGSIRPGGRRWPRLCLEELEDRTLLSFPSLPPFDPNHLTQTLLAPDATQLSITAGQTGTVSRFEQFALNGQSGTVSARFDLAPADPNSTAEGALALYDGSGNLLAKADADPVVGHPGFETLTAKLTSGQVYVLGVFFNAATPNDVFNVTAAPGPQAAQPAITLDPGSGQAPTTADAFGTPATVHYYPLDLLDAGAKGTVTVTPTGQGVDAFATLFRRDQAADPWQAIARGSGTGAFNLGITPPAPRRRART